MTQDKQGPAELLGQQALEAQTALLELPVRLALLGLTAQLVWLELLVPRETPEYLAQREQLARTERLVRLGVPAHLARPGLRVL